MIAGLRATLETASEAALRKVITVPAFDRDADPLAHARWTAQSNVHPASTCAIGIGGDKLTLYSHPAEAAAVYHDGGWSAEQIAREWSQTLEAHAQPSGIRLPALELS
jgi:hypothetical protein